MNKRCNYNPKSFKSIKEIRALDRYAIERLKIPSIVLMENAGRGVAEFVLELLSKRFENPFLKKVIIICGRGNNGGDGFVVARHLKIYGYSPMVLFIGKIDSALKGDNDASINLRILKNMDIEIKEISPEGYKFLESILQPTDVIIDAIFGTGLDRLIRTPYDFFIRAINRFKNKKIIISIDIPSGLDADKGVPLGEAIQADFTITMALPKKGFLKTGAKKYIGKVVTVHIGFPYNLPKNLKDYKIENGK